jgi:hypothetical protein
MPQFFHHLLSLVAGGLLLVILDRVMQPAPVAALPAFLLGAVAYFLSRPGRVLANVLAASFVGATAGMLIHRQWHVTGQSPAPEEGLINHLAHEGLIGLAAAWLCLGAIVLAARLLRR